MPHPCRLRVLALPPPDAPTPRIAAPPPHGPSPREQRHDAHAHLADAGGGVALVPVPLLAAPFLGVFVREVEDEGL